MTKFSDAEDPGYQRVSGELWVWARDLQKRSQSACLEPQPLLENNREDHATGNSFQGSMHNVGQIFQGNSIGSFRYDKP